MNAFEASTSMRCFKFNEDVGYEWWTDWLVEVEENELLEIYLQNLNENDGKDVQVLWERSNGLCTIRRREQIDSNGSLGDDPRMSIEKFIKKLKTELSWWGFDKRISVWTLADIDGTMKYLFKFTKNWECYCD